MRTLERGLNVNTVDSSANTPLHDSIAVNLETILEGGKIFEKTIDFVGVHNLSKMYVADPSIRDHLLR